MGAGPQVHVEAKKNPGSSKNSLKKASHNEFQPSVKSQNGTMKLLLVSL